MIQITDQEVFDACKEVLDPGEEITMADFSPEERARFDRFVSLLNDSLAKKQCTNSPS